MKVNMEATLGTSTALGAKMIEGNDQKDGKVIWKPCPKRKI